ncbi:hypothetical protein E1281_13075 [Actinomadura sp. KC345]|uniref:hypothetical protein n=1 Tax=Actinomadura sp. KC345 TaxID=2530371 RepID=UPI001048C1BE|nr:hypothetical protein [Actinomadura sp. KC345]TDC55313.1 hypothetical protein E1281_13075 [Actinomadura sp. KC345]
MHVAALRTFLVDGPDIWLERYGERLQGEVQSGFSLLTYYALTKAVRIKFSPTYTFPQVIRYVADLRLNLGEGAAELDPRVAEGLIRYTLGDDTYNGRPPFDADQVTLVRTEFHLLLALILEADLDEAELKNFIEDSATLAREWLEARQDAS